MALSCKERILSNDYADWITDFELTEELINLDTTNTDYCYRQVDDRLGLVFAQRNQMREVGLLNYAYQHIPNVFGLQPITTLSSESAYDPTPLINSGITQVQRPPLNLTGKGAVIAFIGTGIDYRNPVFKNPDGTTRILAIWDQTIQTGAPPEGFFYGTEYKREVIDQALRAEDPYSIVPSRDENGHGTALASVAAGSAISEPQVFSGAAPQADILVIKLKECKQYLREYYLLPDQVPAYQSTDLIMAIEYADSFARAFFRPVIFCIGLGSNFGGHSGNSPLSGYLERIGDKRGRVVIITGGNEGNSGHHYSGRLDPITMTDSDNTKDEVEIRVGENERGFLAEVWGKSPNRFSLSIRSPGGESIPNTGVRSDQGTEYQFVYERTRITVSYALVEGATGDQLITLRFENPTPGIWTLELQNDRGLPDAGFHIWLPITDFLSSETYFLKPDPDITLTLPSFVENAVTTASYSDRSNSIFVESGRGFSRGFMIKPDIAAPAVDISLVQRSLPGQMRLARGTGVALSAAITAGGVAQFLQWAFQERRANYIRSNDVKNFLIRGAVREESISYPSRQWGFGKLSIQGVFDSLAGS